MKIYHWSYFKTKTKTIFHVIHYTRKIEITIQFCVLYFQQHISSFFYNDDMPTCLKNSIFCFFRDLVWPLPPLITWVFSQFIYLHLGNKRWSAGGAPAGCWWFSPFLEKFFLFNRFSLIPLSLCWLAKQYYTVYLLSY